MMERRESDLLLMDIRSPGRFFPVEFLSRLAPCVDVFCKVASAALAKDIGVVGRWAYGHGLCGSSKTIAATISQA